jgi:hypothetical protein
MCPRLGIRTGRRLDISWTLVDQGSCIIGDDLIPGWEFVSDRAGLGGKRGTGQSGLGPILGKIVRPGASQAVRTSPGFGLPVTLARKTARTIDPKLH